MDNITTTNSPFKHSQHDSSVVQSLPSPCTRHSSTVGRRGCVAPHCGSNITPRAAYRPPSTTHHSTPPAAPPPGLPVSCVTICKAPSSERERERERYVKGIISAIYSLNRKRARVTKAERVTGSLPLTSVRLQRRRVSWS